MMTQSYRVGKKEVLSIVANTLNLAVASLNIVAFSLKYVVSDR